MWRDHEFFKMVRQAYDEIVSVGYKGVGVRGLGDSYFKWCVSSLEIVEGLMIYGPDDGIGNGKGDNGNGNAAAELTAFSNSINQASQTPMS